MNREYKIDDYGLYNIEEIIDYLEVILGMSFDEIIELFFSKPRIISKEDVVEYCYKNYNNLKESKYNSEINEETVNKRKKDYDIINKKINIYKNKGKEITKIFIYLKQKDAVENIEQKLKQLDINHYENIIIGRDLKRLLIALSNIIICYQNNVDKINDLNTYNNENFDNFYMHSRHAFPNEELLNKDEDYYDRTSLTKCRKK